MPAKDEVLRLRCSAAWKERLQAYCDATDDDMARVVRVATTEYLDRNEKKGPAKMSAAEPVLCISLPMGAALEKGRAPSHDGEYLSVYYRASDPSEWICEGNGGVTATHFQTHAEAEHTDEAEALDARITDALAAPGDADPARSCGSEAESLMLKWGWLGRSQTEGGRIYQ